MAVAGRGARRGRKTAASGHHGSIESFHVTSPNRMQFWQKGKQQVNKPETTVQVASS